MGGLSSIPSRERLRSTLLGSIHTVGRAILQFLRREGMWKELEVVGYRANRMQCSHVHGGFLQGFGTPLAFRLWEVLVCVGGIFQVLDIAMRPDRFPAVNTMKREG